MKVDERFVTFDGPFVSCALTATVGAPNVRRMTKMFSVCMLVVLGLGAEQARLPQPASPGVRIHVEPMGTDHEAVYFAKLLSDHLGRAGYQPSEKTTEDLRLVTTLSTPVIGGETRAFATVELRAGDGRVLWSGEFPENDGWRQPRGRDALRKLAEEIVTAVPRRP
jgi:hypothetical protein